MEKFKYLLPGFVWKLRHYINVPYHTKACFERRYSEKMTITGDKEEILKFWKFPFFDFIVIVTQNGTSECLNWSDILGTSLS